MIKILLETKPVSVAGLVDTSWHQLVSMINSSDETAVCLAAKQGFLESVKYLNLPEHSAEKNEVCQIELEYGVRSNNPAILQSMFQKHETYLREMSSKVIKNRRIVGGSNAFLDNSNRCDTKVVVPLCLSVRILREPDVRTYTTFYTVFT